MTKDEVLKLALEALETGGWNKTTAAIIAIKEALAPHRKPLTDVEIMDNWLKVMWAVGDRNKLPIPEFARAIEAAHGIKE